MLNSERNGTITPESKMCEGRKVDNTLGKFLFLLAAMMLHFPVFHFVTMNTFIILNSTHMIIPFLLLLFIGSDLCRSATTPQ